MQQPLVSQLEPTPLITVMELDIPSQHGRAVAFVFDAGPEAQQVLDREDERRHEEERLVPVRRSRRRVHGAWRDESLRLGDGEHDVEQHEREDTELQDVRRELQTGAVGNR
jgi:hypothetical protein